MQKTLLAIFLYACLDSSAFAQAGFGTDTDGEKEKFDFDSMALELVSKLDKSKAEAMDAARKLVQMQRLAVPVLSDLLSRPEISRETRWYVVWTLSHIRHPSAAQALMPLVKDQEVDADLRMMAVEAVSSGALSGSVEDLINIARNDSLEEMRYKALVELSVQPDAWAQCESLFVSYLNSESDRMRELAVKVCYQVATRKINYFTAERRLVEIARKDSQNTARINAISALSRMKSRYAVKTFFEVFQSETESEAIRKHALVGLQAITGISFVSPQAVVKWWSENGEKLYGQAQPVLSEEDLKKAEAERKESEKVSSASIIERGEAKAPAQVKVNPSRILKDDAEEEKGFRGVIMGE